MSELIPVTFGYDVWFDGRIVVDVGIDVEADVVFSIMTDVVDLLALFGFIDVVENVESVDDDDSVVESVELKDTVTFMDVIETVDTVEMVDRVEFV